MMLKEDLASWSALADPMLTPEAGLGRYAAAMNLYKDGRLGEGTLEEFRAHAKDTTGGPAIRAEAEVRALLAEIVHYVDRLPFQQLAAVKSGIKRWQSGGVVPLAPRYSPACRYLTPALQACDVTPLVSAIWRAAPILQWGTYDAYPVEQIGESFAANHAFASVAGAAAPILAEDFDLGLFVIGPEVLYRDHRHKAPELYAPLTGPHRWRFSPGAPFESKPAHEPVWNDPYAPHATLTGNVPFLCIYCWTRDVDESATVIAADDWSQYEKR